MISKTFISFLLLFFILSAQSCTDEDSVPQKYVQPNEMESVLLDMKAAHAYAENMRIDSPQNRILTIKKLYKEILEIHHLTPDQFMKSYHYYEAHPKVMQNVYDSLLVDITRRSKIYDSLHRHKLIRRR
jgi:Domain of unknown function (DUF4296)